MKVTLFLVLAHLSAVLAGGYQGCLERVLLFNAYEIDGLNDEADQTIGFKCAKPDTKNKSCSKWNACTPKRNSGRTRCNFDELMVFLGKAPTQTGWSVDDSDGKLDPEGTAKQCYKIFTTAPGKNPKVVNFPPHVAAKDAWEYNDYIKRITNTVNNTYKNKGNIGNRGLWTSFDTTMAKVSEARAGDHGPHLIQAANDALSSKMDIQTQDLGSGKNPATGEVWKTVDWKETAKQAKAKGVPDVDKEIQGFLKDFYGGTNKQARDHRVVIQSYKRATDKSLSCR
ncbi:uncharacterized protein F4807DRAFT_426490 [Annulohypoxylon truncatum]|uniref:uncharacterized protein n=1 Tax=Annulohypoxylon truncatum TaxID=327061 RepID=UPI0020085965|nr:uncharacterized protein F4807DRAFT_426490 [Annulohypoxylon truncatum]KAI1209374.1 hypothetical protein F4807DRAFT_426490 [Annulohypoxylon truncatum]